MRNITKFKRSIRAISPVISVLLMIAIAVVASLVAYAWVMGYMNFQQGKIGNSIQIPSYAEGDDAANQFIKVYVQNTGQGTLKLSLTQSVYVNDVLKTITAVGTDTTPDDPVVLPEGETRELTVDLGAGNSWTAGTQIKIKIVTVEGTIMEVKGTGTSSNPNNNNPPANVAPVADFTFQVTNLVVDFTDASTDSDGSIASRTWDFGDSTATSSNVNPTHTYATAGAYTVRLTVSDDDNAQHFVEKSVTVSEAAASPVIDTSTPTSDPTISEIGSQVFSITCHDPNSGDTLTQQWTLEGVAVGTGLSYTYTPDYSSAGQYNVKVVVSDGSLTAEREWTITVTNENRKPSIDTSSPATVTLAEGGSQIFSITCSDPDGDGLTQQWTIDGTQVGTGLSYTYSPDYSSSGPHTVRVTVSDGSLTDVHEWTFTVANTQQRKTIFEDTFESGSSFKTQWVSTSQADIVDANSGHAARIRYNSANGYMTLQFDVTGYTSIELNYQRNFDRSGWNDGSQDHFYIQWKVGTGSSWSSATTLEDAQGDITSWATQTKALTGASGIIQIRFSLSNCESGEYALIDNISLTGMQ